MCRAPDVVEAVNFARSRKLLAAVRSGGHNVAGCSVCDDGVVIDLSRMKRIEVDPARRIARAEAGLTLGEFDTATQSYGLATTMGVNSDTGIAGLTLGGGFGKLGRKYGLTCDNLLAAEIVTADGGLFRVSETENPDLFWGIRGGGGNFGIVTTFEYRLHPVGPKLLAGSVLHDYKHAQDAMQFYYAFSSNAPDELSADAALVTTPSGEEFFAISACYIGPVEEGERAVKPLRGVRFASRKPLCSSAILANSIGQRHDLSAWAALLLEGSVHPRADRGSHRHVARGFCHRALFRFPLGPATGWRRNRAGSEICNALREQRCVLRLLPSRGFGMIRRTMRRTSGGRAILEGDAAVLNGRRVCQQFG